MSVKWLDGLSIRERIVEKRSDRKSRSKTMLITMVMAFLSLVSIFAFFRVCTQNMEDNIKQSLQQSVEQRKINIDFRLRSLLQADENLISLLYPYMNADTARSEQLAEYEELQSVLSAYRDSEYISNTRVYVPDEKLYSTQGAMFYPLSRLLGLEEADRIPYLRRAGISWLETQLVSMADGYSGRLVPTNALTCAHSMRSRADYSQISFVLMLDVDVSMFNELLSSDTNLDQRGYLINSQGMCLAAVDQSLIRKQILSEDLLEQIKKENAGCLEANKRVYVYQKLEYNDWYIVMDYPSSALSITNSPQSGFLQVLVLAVTIMALTMMFVLAYNITMNAAISRINAAMDGLNTGKEQDSGEVSEFLNPLHHLEKNTDQMVLTVKELMEERYRDQLAIADSQMKSLQAQIKPHFLYNTLDIIKWMVLDEKNDEAAWMVNSLSKYLRQSINKGPGIIPLREELELSRIYLTIMQKRFDNRFEVSFEVEDVAKDCMIPKLSLQPMLENALLHGLVYCEKPDKELTVRAWVADESLYLEVEDNGNGMTEEQRQSLENGEAGYGFANVRKRLGLFSKGEAEVQVFSREGMGTCIAVRFPAVWDNAENVQS